MDYIENQIPNWQELVDGELKKQNINYKHTLGSGMFGLTNKGMLDNNSNDPDYQVNDQDTIDKLFDDRSSNYDFIVANRLNSGIQLVELPNSQNQAHFLPLRSITTDVNI